jgi:uncharacterized protein (TIGR00255 family)
MNSMTGFGRGTATVGQRRLVVEARSVNHRGIDVKVRGRDLDGGCEIEVIRAVRAAIERGSVVVGVREEGGPRAAVDFDRLRSLHASLEAARAALGLAAPVDLQTVAAFLAATDGAAEGAPIAWEELGPALAQALEALAAMRAAEGRALAVDLRARLERLRRTVAAIDAAAAGLPTRARRRLEDRLASVVGASDAPLDPARLATEVALLAERLDVSEELVRLETHLAHLQRLVDGAAAGAAGRKMDFVVQEIGRELNTVAAKVQDAEIAALVIDAKAELEKIREQAQNVE